MPLKLEVAVREAVAGSWAGRPGGGVPRPFQCIPLGGGGGLGQWVGRAGVCPLAAAHSPRAVGLRHSSCGSSPGGPSPTGPTGGSPHRPVSPIPPPPPPQHATHLRGGLHHPPLGGVQLGLHRLPLRAGLLPLGLQTVAGLPAGRAQRGTSCRPPATPAKRHTNTSAREPMPGGGGVPRDLLRGTPSPDAGWRCAERSPTSTIQAKLCTVLQKKKTGSEQCPGRSEAADGDRPTDVG